MPRHDSFQPIAAYYDAIMEHVDYDRWAVVTAAVADLLEEPFIHLDTACGTAMLIKRLRRFGWRSFGADLSYSMLRAGRRGERRKPPVAVGDLRALPFRGSIDYITCLFDSMNFLLDLEDIRAALRQFASALRDGGLLYFDVVTERMVLDHFAGQQWTENNGAFRTRWDSRYDPKIATAETLIQVNQGPSTALYERVYNRADIEAAVSYAGLTVLGVFDAENWKKPGRRTVRLDFVCCKGPANAKEKSMPALVRRVRESLR